MLHSTKGKWSRICVDNKCFIYGPRLGALYLLPNGRGNDRLLFNFLGLQRFCLQNDLIDPTLYIVHDLTVLNESKQDIFRVSNILCSIYRFIHWSRHIVPFPMMLNILTKIFYIFRNPRQVRSPFEIGKILHAIENKIGTHDCYPRAIITACLCAQNSLSWDVTIGILSPTRMMHAWCSTNGALPYEPFPEHHMYQPLIIFSKAYSQD